jgi:hypothetical protein
MLILRAFNRGSPQDIFSHSYRNASVRGIGDVIFLQVMAIYLKFMIKDPTLQQFIAILWECIGHLRQFIVNPWQFMKNEF